MKLPDPALVHLSGRKIGRIHSKLALVPRVAHCLCLGDIWRLLGVGMDKMTIDDQGCNERGGDAVEVLSPLGFEG